MRLVLLPGTRPGVGRHVLRHAWRCLSACSLSDSPCLVKQGAIVIADAHTLVKVLASKLTGNPVQTFCPAPLVVATPNILTLADKASCNLYLHCPSIPAKPCRCRLLALREQSLCALQRQGRRLAAKKNQIRLSESYLVLPLNEWLYSCRGPYIAHSR